MSLCTITCADQARISNAWVAERVIGWCTDQTTRVRVGRTWDRGWVGLLAVGGLFLDGWAAEFASSSDGGSSSNCEGSEEWPRFSTQGRQKEAPTRRDFRIQCGRLSLLFHKTEAANQREEGDGRGAVRLRRQGIDEDQVVWFHPRAAGRLRPPAGSMGGWANSSAVACLQRFNAASTRPPCSQAEAGAVLARPTHALRPTLLSHRFMRTPLAEQEIEAHLSRIFKEREERELAREPSLAQIPRILLRKPPTQAQSSLPQQELGRQARARLREKMSNLVLQHLELEQMWGLLKKHASPPHQPSAFSPLTHASQLGAGPGAARPPHLTPHIPRHTRGA